MGYGPGSLSLEYWNVTGTLPCDPRTTMYGMPFGAPFHTVPKSGCSDRVAPQLAINAAELGSTGSAETSRFHALSTGKSRRP